MIPTPNGEKPTLFWWEWKSGKGADWVSSEEWMEFRFRGSQIGFPFLFRFHFQFHFYYYSHFPEFFFHRPFRSQRFYPLVRFPLRPADSRLRFSSPFRSAHSVPFPHKLASLFAPASAKETTDRPAFRALPTAGDTCPDERNRCRQRTAQTVCSLGESETAENERCSETRDCAGWKEPPAPRPREETTENTPPFAAARLHPSLSRTNLVARAMTWVEPEHSLPISINSELIRFTPELEISLFR